MLARAAPRCITHGRRRVAIHGTEVALTINERVAHGEILRHADQGVVDRGVAVRVQLTHDVADHARGFLGGPVMGAGRISCII